MSQPDQYYSTKVRGQWGQIRNYGEFYGFWGACSEFLWGQNKMAAAVLQPSESKMTSLAPEISKARQRRRRSTRRSEGLTRSPNLETQGTRELGPSALADNVSTSDAASSVLDSTVGSVDSALTGEYYELCPSM